MRKKNIKIFQRVAFVAILCVAVCWLDSVLRPHNSINDMTATFLSEEPDSLDIIAVGASHLYCTFDPVSLYRNCGYKSFVLSSSLQPLPATYRLLELALEQQHPKLAILETYMLLRDPDAKISSACQHDIFDSFPMGTLKLKVLNDMHMGRDWFEYAFPIIKHHSRWKDIRKWDFRAKSKHDPKRGFQIYANVRPTSASKLEILSCKPEILDEETLQWLDRFAELTRSSGSTFMLLAGPYDIASRGRARDRALHEWAAANNVPYLDLNVEFDECGIDPNSDFLNHDHLNIYGADKATAFVGRYIMEHFNFTPKQANANIDKMWQEDCKHYDVLRSAAVSKATKKNN